MAMRDGGPDPSTNSMLNRFIKAVRAGEQNAVLGGLCLLRVMQNAIKDNVPRPAYPPCDIHVDDVWYLDRITLLMHAHASFGLVPSDLCQGHGRQAD